MKGRAERRITDELMRDDTADGAGLTLVITPTLRASFREDGSVRVAGRFVEGMRMWARLWQGPVVALMRQAGEGAVGPDDIEVDPADLPFGLFRADFADEAVMAASLADAAVVLASLDCDQTHLAGVCAKLGVPCVYAADQSPETRRRSIAVGTSNPLRRLRREVWTRRLEGRLTAALALAAGVQCDGLAAYEAYRGATPDALLYFDSRVTRAMLADDATVRARGSDAIDGGPLRVVFVGELSGRTGAEDLPEFARRLRDAGAAYTMDVYGDGPLRRALAARFERYAVAGPVRLRGEVAMEELIPRLAEEADVAVMLGENEPGRYLELMAGGVPVAGYRSAGWAGLLAAGGGLDMGAATAPGDPAELARVVAAIDRWRLAAAGRSVRAFAGTHTFERTFARRAEHLRGLSRVRGRVGTC